MELSKRTIRQIENMSKTCRFDMDNQIALINLHYDTPDDLLDIHLSHPGKPVISDDAVDYLCELISTVPNEFDVEFSLTIDDYGDYDHKSLMDSIRATIENTFYYHDEYHKKHNVLGVVFIVIAILILALDIIGGSSGWYGDKGNVGRSILETIFEVIVWVFLWEGAALIFLTYENESTVFSKNMKRVNGIRLLNKKGEEMISLNAEQFYDGWIYIGKRETLARNYILISNAALLALISTNTIEFLSKLSVISTMHKVFFLIGWIFTVVLVICNISFYKEHESLGKYASFLNIVTLALTIGNILFSVIRGNASQKFIILEILFAVALFINLLCLHYLQKQNIEVTGEGIKG